MSFEGLSTTTPSAGLAELFDGVVDWTLNWPWAGQGLSITVPAHSAMTVWAAAICKPKAEIFISGDNSASLNFWAMCPEYNGNSWRPPWMPNLEPTL